MEEGSTEGVIIATRFKEALNIFDLEPKLKDINYIKFIDKITSLFVKRFREDIAVRYGKSWLDPELISNFDPIAEILFKDLFKHIDLGLLFNAYHIEKRHIISGYRDLYYANFNEITVLENLKDLIIILDNCHSFVLSRCYDCLRKNEFPKIEDIC